MAIIRPPITGDISLDSFLDQVSRQVSRTVATVEQFSAPTVTPGGDNIFSATLRIYQRTATNDNPGKPDTDVVYNYETGVLSVNGVATTNFGGNWSFNEPPSILDGPYLWTSYVHISEEGSEEEIPSDAWATPALDSASTVIAGIPIPSTPTGVSLTHVQPDVLRFSWDFQGIDTEHPGLYAVVETSFPGTEDSEWSAAAVVTYPDNSLTFTGIAVLDTPQSFRVRAGNILISRESATSGERTYTPVLPSQPTSVSIIRESEDLAVLEWDYSETLSTVQVFEIEVAYDSGVYSVDNTATAAARSHYISSLGSNSQDATYRIRALGLNKQYGPYSDVVDLPALTPNTPTSLVFTQNSVNEGLLTWAYVPNFSLVSHFEIQESINDTESYNTVITLGSEDNSWSRTGLATEDDTLYFRVRAVSLNGKQSDWSLPVVFTPGIPNAPTGLTFTKINADEGRLSWNHTSNFAVIRNFVIESRQVGDTNFGVVGTSDGSDTDFVITGLAVRANEFEYRVRAVNAHGDSSGYSTLITVSPSPRVAPTGLVATPIERVGVLTSVDLSWSSPQDSFNTYSTLTIQFRPEDSVTWLDIATVAADETSVELQPPRQGLIYFRIRSTAVNGLHSEYSPEEPVFVSGGSATDDAIYGGDGAFISTRHYSVNSDDFYMDDTDAVVVQGGGARVGTTITGNADSELLVDWSITVSQNMVDRERHFYLNLDTLQHTGSGTNPWGIDNGTVALEILSDPRDSALMFTTNDSSFIYTDAPGANDSNTRTYDERESAGFMYATRTFIRLPIRRTFTFREAGRATIRLRFLPQAGTQPIIRMDTNNALKFEAFATERIDDTELTVGALGTEWVFSEDFEAPPQIFITPTGNVNTWYTNKSATSVRIHASTNNTDVDVTARGR